MLALLHRDFLEDLLYIMIAHCLMPLSLSEQNTLGPSFQQKYIETSILKYCWVWVFIFFLLKKYPPHTYSFFEKRNKPRPLRSLLVYKMEFYIRNILLIRTQKLSESHPYFLYNFNITYTPFPFSKKCYVDMKLKLQAVYE